MAYSQQTQGCEATKSLPIDKSTTYRGDAKIPLVAAGVNHDLVTDEVRLVANPNCTTIPPALTQLLS